jgi:hypothetical protein
MDKLVDPDLTAVGYWRSDEQPDLPRPEQFVGTLQEELRDNLSRYLASGVEFADWMGYSHCRFACGTPDRAMGNRDLTDGVWVWPEGLSHYVCVHSVMPPKEFLQHAARQAWKIGQVTVPPFHAHADGSSGIPVTYEFWRRARTELERAETGRGCRHDT